MEENKNQTEAETEEEMRKRLKEEIMAELKEEMKEEKKLEKVNFKEYNDSGLQEVNEMNRKDRTMQKKKNVDNPFHLPQAEDDEKGNASIVILFIAFIVMIGVIFFFPKAYQYFANKEKKSTIVETSNSSSNEETVYETITKDSDVLENFTYPIMRNTPYEKGSYYQRDSVTMSDFSNNDILYNAFLNVYVRYIADYKGTYQGTYCGTEDTKKYVKAAYLDARIANLFSRSTKYEHADFTVPSTNTDTTYVGTWKYDSKNNYYIYYGDCNGITKSNIVYYDLQNIVEATGLQNNTIVEVTYQLGFAQVNTTSKQYTIYSDANMTDPLTTGTLSSSNYQTELNTIFENYISQNTLSNSYKYTFSTNNCSYQDYCFEKGEWVK